MKHREKTKQSEDSYEELYILITLLEKKEELRKFLDDVLTERELKNIHKRILTAFLLGKGYTFEAIREALGIGTQKIINVKHILDNGNGGYNLIFEKLAFIKVDALYKDYPSLSYPFSHPLSLFAMLHRLSKPSPKKVIKK